jgi:hypothetical protein
MKNHKCKQLDYCICSIQGLEPTETRPIHGAGEWPPRCMYCGRFMKKEHTWEIPFNGNTLVNRVQEYANEVNHKCLQKKR